MKYSPKEIREFLKQANSDLGNPKYVPKDLIADYAVAVIIGKEQQCEIDSLKKTIEDMENDNLASNLGA